MHGCIIGDPSPHDQTAKRAPLLRMSCYLDTVSWTFQTKYLARREWKRLVDCYGDKPHVFQPRHLPCSIYTFQCPQPDLIDECELLESLYDGNVKRFDIGCDVRPHSTTLDWIEQTRKLREIMLLRNRAKAPFKPITNDDGTIGTFFNPFPDGGDPPARDIVLYPDPCSKLHGKPCAHFDFRLREHACRKALREQGIGKHGLSLTMLDPSITLRSNIRIVECDINTERRDYFEHLGKGHTLAEATRLIEHAKRHGQTEYVQRLRDQYPQCKVIDARNSVLFSKTLKWGATRRNDRSTRHMVHVNDHKDLDR